MKDLPTHNHCGLEHKTGELWEVGAGTPDLLNHSDQSVTDNY